MYVILDRCSIHSDLSDSFLERSIRLVLPLKWAQSLARLGSFLRELRARELGKEGRKLGGGRVQKEARRRACSLVLRELKFLLSSR